jgi:hypothetical protein
VVATEVKDLAQETAKATEDISRRVATIQDDTGQAAVAAIATIAAVIAQINDYQRTIAAAVEEQTATTSEMARNAAVAQRPHRVAGSPAGRLDQPLGRQQPADAGAGQLAPDHGVVQGGELLVVPVHQQARRAGHDRRGRGRDQVAPVGAGDRGPEQHRRAGGVAGGEHRGRVPGQRVGAEQRAAGGDAGPGRRQRGRRDLGGGDRDEQPHEIPVGEPAGGHAQVGPAGRLLPEQSRPEPAQVAVGVGVDLLRAGRRAADQDLRRVGQPAAGRVREEQRHPGVAAHVERLLREGHRRRHQQGSVVAAQDRGGPGDRRAVGGQRGELGCAVRVEGVRERVVVERHGGDRTDHGLVSGCHPAMVG